MTTEHLTPRVLLGGTPRNVINRGPRMLAGEIGALAARRQGCSLRLGTVTSVAGNVADVTVMGSPMVEIGVMNPGGLVVDDVVHVLIDRDGMALVLNPGGDGGGGGSVAWVDITGKPSTFPAAWADITGKPSTFTPTAQAMGWLTDVDTTGATDGQHLSYEAGVWVPVTPDEGGGGGGTTGGIYNATLPLRSITADDSAFVQWGSSLVIPNPGVTVDVAMLLTGWAGVGPAVGPTTFEVRVDYSLNGGSTWVTDGQVVQVQLNSVSSIDIDAGALVAQHAALNVTPTGDIHVRAMSKRTLSTAGAATFNAGRLRAIIPGGTSSEAGIVANALVPTAATVTVPTNAWTKLALSTTATYINGMTIASGNLVATYSGHYLITASTDPGPTPHMASTVARVMVGIGINGAAPGNQTGYHAGPGMNFVPVVGSFVVSLTAGDTVSLYAFQQTAVDRSYVVGANTFLAAERFGAGLSGGSGAWTDITGKPSTFPPTVQVIDWLSDVDTTTVVPVAGNVLGWDGSKWVPTIGGEGGAGAYLPLAGGTMAGNLNMGDYILHTPKAPTAGHHVGDRAYNDGRYLQSAGDAMTGDIDMNSNRITFLPKPTGGAQPVTVDYGYTIEAVGMLGPTIHIGTGTPSGGHDDDVWIQR